MFHRRIELFLMSKPNPVPPLTTEELDALRRLDAGTLANAIETFRVRLRNEGFVHGSVRCLFPQLQSMHGVQSIPLELAGRIPAVATEIAAKHRAIIDVCHSPEFSLEKLREAVRKNQI
jgi:hypothetical protein